MADISGDVVGVKDGEEVRGVRSLVISRVVDVDCAVLHDEITRGDREVPSRFSAVGRKYAKWLKLNKKHAAQVERLAKQVGNQVPVVGERGFSTAGARGFVGRLSGQAMVVSGGQRYQTTTNLGGGFNPNVVGAPAPAIGTPIGQHVITGAEICCDPLAWFREGIIDNPSFFLMSVPAKGKSTLVRKMLMGDVAQGHIPIIAGDIKGEYVGFVHQVGGQVISLGGGDSRLNPLDVGALGRAIPTLEAEIMRLREDVAVLAATADAVAEFVDSDGDVEQQLQQVQGELKEVVAQIAKSSSMGEGDSTLLQQRLQENELYQAAQVTLIKAERKVIAAQQEHDRTRNHGMAGLGELEFDELLKKTHELDQRLTPLRNEVAAAQAEYDRCVGIIDSIAKKEKRNIIADAQGQRVLLEEQKGILEQKIDALLLLKKQSESYQITERITELERLVEHAKSQIQERQVTMVSTLLSLSRQEPLLDWEAMVVSIALGEIYSQENIDWDNPPILQDLIEYLERGSPRLRQKARAESDEAWDQQTKPLLLSLNALLDGATGKIFSGQTTEPISVDSSAVCIDVSAIDGNNAEMKAAVMMSCWSNAFGAIQASHILADAGLEKQKYFSVTLDEMWQVMGAAPQMVQKIDALTRLNRTVGTSLNMITHTMKDLEALASEKDQKIAKGFIARAGMLIVGGLDKDELVKLNDHVQFSPAEQTLITSWAAGANPKRSRGQKDNSSRGVGCFMIKTAKDGTPGIPVRTVLTPTEVAYRLHDTNKRFDDFFQESSGGVEEKSSDA